MNMKVATCPVCMNDIMNGEDWHWRPAKNEPVHEKCEPRTSYTRERLLELYQTAPSE
jgi:hypothetical protein